MLNKILNFFASMVYSSAKAAVATTSMVSMCQPKEPEIK
jgi:cyclic lactone autoinducer peptide